MNEFSFEDLDTIVRSLHVRKSRMTSDLESGLCMSFFFASEEIKRVDLIINKIQKIKQNATKNNQS